MKQVIIGHYSLGPQQVHLVLREGDGGEFYSQPADGEVPRIKVGADYKSWSSVVRVLHHEAMEFAMTQTRVRYSPSPDYSCGHDGYVFIMTHPQFSEVGARVGEFLADCLPDVSRAWSRWQKAAKRNSRR